MDVEMEAGTADLPDGAETSDREALFEGTLEVVRDMILRGNPELVPEMVRGETLAELLGSVEPAREAYRRVIDEVKALIPVVPAGGVTRSVEEGPADVLIKRAIERRRG